MNNDQVCDNKFVIESVDNYGRIDYDGLLSENDISVLQLNVSSINYYITGWLWITSDLVTAQRID